MKKSKFASACIASVVLLSNKGTVRGEYPSLTALENDQEITLYV